MTQEKGPSPEVIDNLTNAFRALELFDMEMQEGEEEILNPPHYTHGRAIEPLDVIEDWGLDRDYYLGNAVKYISRYNRKDPMNPLSCLKKAIFYLQRKVDRMEGKM